MNMNERITEATLSQVFSADSLSSDQRVEWSGLTWPGSAVEALAAVGGVNAAGSTFLKSAGHAAAAAGLSQHLLAIRWDGRTAVQLLLRAGGTADGFRSHHWARPYHSQHSQSYCCPKPQGFIKSKHFFFFFGLQFSLKSSLVLPRKPALCDWRVSSKEISMNQPYLYDELTSKRLMIDTVTRDIKYF